MGGAAAVLAAVLSAGCYATHEYQEIRESPAAPASVPAALPVRIAMVAGELHLGRAAPDRLYDLKLKACRNHFLARVEHGTSAAPALEVGIRRRPGRDPGMPTDEERNVVDLALGQQTPVDLRLDLGAGHHEVELGGIRLAGLAVACGSGGLALGFGEPTLGDPEQIMLDAGTGTLVVRQLGNASPGFVAVRGGSGSIRLDLSGIWRRDAQIQLDVRLAEVLLDVPRALAVEIRAAGRDPADLVLPEFGRDAGGRFLSPGYAGESRRHLSIEVGPGIGRVEARLVQ
jgi:hypothetical protein